VPSFVARFVLRAATIGDEIIVNDTAPIAIDQIDASGVAEQGIVRYQVRS